MFSAAVCKIQASKCYIESLQSVPNNKRSWFSQSERSTVQLPLDHVFAPGSIGRLIDIYIEMGAFACAANEK